VAIAATGTTILLPGHAEAASHAGPELTVSASDDTYISTGRRSATFGAEDKLVIGELDGDVKTSFLKFTVRAGTRVGGARLLLNTVGPLSGRVTVRRVLDNSWTEARLTSANAPALGRPVATATPKATDTSLSFDLGAEIDGPGTYSFALTSSSIAATLRIRSSEGRWGAPGLVVNTESDVSPPGSSAPGTTRPGTTRPGTTRPGITRPGITRPGITRPGTVPATTVRATTAAGTGCVTGALLVPSCGVLWGGAAGGFTTAPRDQALIGWEKLTGRTATIFHTYHKGDEPFPTKAEIAMTRDAAHPRVLLLNWKIAYGSTWSKVAAGKLDRRIDAFAGRAKTYGSKFFLALNHEPENDVIATAGSGMQAKDFAAMYRHTILRLRADGVTNAVNVVAYMGNEHWMAQSWWRDLYPGDNVVDWMGLDSYVSVVKGYHFGLFADLLDRAATGGGPGFYDWATANHPGKPMMIAEWGAYHPVGHPADKAAVYRSVRPELAERPAIKAIVHFDTKHDDTGDRDISVDSTKASLAAFRKLATDPIFNVKLG
jgi:beta-mannanase